MNILVIGNGFDLAHKLPTGYTDFLKFVEKFTRFYDKDELESSSLQDLRDKKDKTNEDIIILMLAELFDSKYSNNDLSNDDEIEFAKNIIEELHNICVDNVWLEYFLQCDMHGEENWIDFESEISEVIQSIDRDMRENHFYSNIIRLSKEFFNDKYTNNVPEYLQATAKEQKKIRKSEITYKRLRDILLEDLDKLIRALEIYLTDFVKKIDISKIFKELDIDHVLSFNYTDTYEDLYNNDNKKNNIEYDYIHGQAKISNTMQTNNMVLGIDEYLDDDRRNKDIEFIAFKKYYQRIYKQTGCKYKEWVGYIKENWEGDFDESKKEIKRCISKGQFENPKIHRLYIFGHSLDITDRDILRDLILNDNVHTTIYYHTKDDLGNKIANLVKVIGQDELIKRTGGSTKTIEFKDQQKIIRKKDSTTKTT